MAGDVKVGDTVKVTFEAEVIKANSGELCLASDALSTVWVALGKVEVEKVEPEYEVFGPGDVVRSKGTGWLYMIADDGRYTNANGRRHEIAGDEFTSQYYERVT